jgi:hypothetical protein
MNVLVASGLGPKNKEKEDWFQYFRVSTSGFSSQFEFQRGILCLSVADCFILKLQFLGI